MHCNTTPVNHCKKKNRCKIEDEKNIFYKNLFILCGLLTYLSSKTGRCHSSIASSQRAKLSRAYAHKTDAEVRWAPSLVPGTDDVVKSWVV